MKTVVIFVVVIFAVLFLYLAAGQANRLKTRELVILAFAGIGSYTVFLVLRPEGWLLADAMVLLTAAVLGSALGLLMNSRPALVSFCVAASVVDIISVTAGATAGLVETWRAGSSNLLLYLAVSVPWSGRIHPIVGIGDLIVTCALYYALGRLGYRGALMFGAPLTGLLLALVAGLLLGGIFAIPFIAVTTIGFVLAVDPVKPSNT